MCIEGVDKGHKIRSSYEEVAVYQGIANISTHSSSFCSSHFLCGLGGASCKGGPRNARHE
jgi:hypothetical protein